jgi:hypothetical protein
MKSNSTRSVKVESGGEGVVAHVGLHALGQLADKLQLGSLLSSRIAWTGERAPGHDRGKVLTQMALMLAGGGESCRDIEHLRSQTSVFASVPSDSTVHRTMHQFNAAARSEIAVGLRDVRHTVWQRAGLLDTTDAVTLDIDATLVEVHSENKEGSAPNYKSGFGFHPLLCFADATGEVLSAQLRPGNAGSNTVSDHITLLDAAIAQLPDEVALGHRVSGQEETQAIRELVVRTDGAGCTKEFLAACRQRNVGFFTSARSNAQVESAIYETRLDEEMWTPARRANGELREGAAVCELTEWVNLAEFPSGTRLIVRREPLHQGAQRTLFFDANYRFTAFYCDRDGDPVELDQTMREHAHVEQHIQRLKDSGLTAMPFTNFEANANWLMTVALAADLVRWFQLLCLDGRWRNARPKTLRWALLHAPGRLVKRSRRRVIRILDGWPDAATLLGAYKAIALIT